MASGKRPEHRAPPEIFYGQEEAQKYTRNSRIIEIQIQMAERAVELLCLPEGEMCLVGDLGCGSGLSGTVLEEAGHLWVGLDISPAMLDVALERETKGELTLGDLGQGVPFRAGSLDGAISISTLQWLCNADKASHLPHKRLYVFFSTLYSALRRSARAVFQFYPENSEQIELVTTQATRAGFSGGLVVDFPNSTKAKKYFLVLMTCGGTLPRALGMDDKSSVFTAKRERQTIIRGKPIKKTKNWILEKKERRRRQGLETRNDSKFTARRRCGKF